MKNTILIISAVFLVSCQLFSQRIITGVIKDSQGESLIGASIVIEGTSIGTITDFNGHYSLKIPYRSKQMIVSYYGYKTATISINTSNTLNVTLKKKSVSNKLYLSFGGAYNIISQATTNSLGLEDDFSGRLNYYALIGFNFWKLKKWSFSVESGVVVRDFGFEQNNSTISYLSIPINLRIKIGKENKFVGLELFGGAEYATLMENLYYYIDTNNISNETYNIFLHQNDSILGTYGGAIRFGKQKVQVLIFSESVIQLDSFDAQFGKTIGTSSVGAAIRYKMF